MFKPLFQATNINNNLQGTVVSDVNVHPLITNMYSIISKTYVYNLTVSIKGWG